MDGQDWMHICTWSLMRNMRTYNIINESGEIRKEGMVDKMNRLMDRSQNVKRKNEDEHVRTYLMICVCLVGIVTDGLSLPPGF